MVRKNDATAAAVSEPAPTTSLSAVPQDEATTLAGVLEDFDFGLDDGLREVDGEDLRLPVIVWNRKGKDERTGELFRIDEFFDTLNEKSHKTLRCAFIHLHKTNLFARFDNDKNENVIHCSSHDRVVGRLRTNHPDLNIIEGTERNCAICPDKEWAKDAKGKNVRNCSPVYGVFGVMLDDDLRPQDPFLIRFKRTGLQPFKTHMQKHHINKRQLPGGKWANMPLFVYEVTMRLVVSKNGNFATPEIERGRPLPKPTIAALFEQSKFFGELGAEATQVAERAEKQEAAESTGGGAQVSGEDFADT